MNANEDKPQVTWWHTEPEICPVCCYPDCHVSTDGKREWLGCIRCGSFERKVGSEYWDKVTEEK